MKKTVEDHAKLAARSAVTARKAGETMNSAAHVIGARTEMAFNNPGVETGVEMNRMMSEKLSAFTEAGAAMAKGANDLSSASAAYAAAEAAAAQRAAAAMAACRSPMEFFALQGQLMSEFVARSMAFGVSVNTVATQTGEDTLGPIHKTVEANAKRLKK